MMCESSESEKRYYKLFNKLDPNGDGKIDVRDLVALFNEHKKCEKNKESSLSQTKVDSLNSRSVIWILFFRCLVKVLNRI